MISLINNRMFQPLDTPVPNKGQIACRSLPNLLTILVLFHFDSGSSIFCKKLKNVSCEYNRLNRWNSTLQAAWYIRHVRSYNRYQVCFLWTKRTIWLLILSFTQNIIRACFMFYPYEGYRTVTPLDAPRVNRTMFHNHSAHWCIEGGDYIKRYIITRHGQQNPHRGRRLQ